jgi:arginine utilization protein RocB
MVVARFGDSAGNEVTSHRRRKQKAQSMGLTDAELQLCELLAQVLELLRWNQVLGYSNQYLLHQKLGLSAEERHRVMRAAASAVEQDGRLQDWGRRLIEIQDSLQRIHAQLLGQGETPADGGTAEAASGA